MRITKFSAIIILILVINNQNLFSQSSDIKEFLPLNTGNTWVYYYSGGLFGPFSGFEKYKIISEYTANGKTYFKFSHLRVVLAGSSTYVVQSRLFNDTAAIRIDSVSGIIYRNILCHGSFEMPVDSLKAGLNDTTLTCFLEHGDTVVCSDTASNTYFGNLRASRTFTMPAFEGNNDQVYAMHLGLVGFTYHQLNHFCWVTLKGCIINGVLYGDTSLVGIKQISTKVPDKFSLSQNYPNPFNPLTTIKFDIPLNSCQRGNDKVILNVFDVLGREIAILVNEHLSPGTYEIEWNGTNCPSGVYFYKLISGDYVETRKMVLIK